MKIVQLTDTHLVPPGESLYGLDPAARLSQCLDSINAEHGDADLCVVTGDLADRGDVASYRLLRQLLTPLLLPWRLMLGNHDDRAAFLSVFPDTATAQGYVQATVDTPRGVLVLLDTLEHGRADGVLCATRLAWLDRILTEARDRPVYLFMHHPPLPIGMTHFDGMTLADPASLLSLIRDHGDVRHVFFGHVHIGVSGRWGPVSFSSVRGTCQHIELDLANRDTEFAHGSPAYGVILIDDDGVMVHTRDFLAPTPRYDAMTGRPLHR